MRWGHQASRRGRYKEVRWGRTSRRNHQNAMQTLVGLIVANVVVFFLWSQARSVPAFGVLLSEHFLVSAESLVGLRLWTVVTYAFSHIDFRHLLFNMLALYFFGRDIAQTYGSRALLELYVWGAVAGGVAHAAWTGLTGDGSPALGASGSVMAISAAFALVWPNRTILLNFFIPVPAWVLVVGYVALGITGAVGGGGNVAHAAHLGGLAAGAALWAMRFRR